LAGTRDHAGSSSRGTFSDAGACHRSTTLAGDNIMGLGKGALLWLIGIPLPIIILLVLFWR
jgi:hypothetical protein